MNSTDSLTPAQIRRGRRMAGLMFLVGFGPVVLATLMYVYDWGIPQGTANQGELIVPTVSIAPLALSDAEGQALAQRYAPDRPAQPWRLLVLASECDTACEHLLHLGRQVHIALGREADRVGRALALPTGTVLPVLENDSLLTLHTSRPPAAPVLILIDPLGNQVLRYRPEGNGKAVLNDLKRLLKLSQIG